jgi:hypothetical protein
MRALTAASAVPAAEIIARDSNTVHLPHLAPVERLRAPDLGDQACGIPSAESGVAQVFNCFAVALDLDRAFLVTVAEEALDKDNGPQLRVSRIQGR